MKNGNSSDELVISYLFPPSKDVAGMVLAKRHMVEGKRFDVIQADVKKDCDYEFSEQVDKYVNKRIAIDAVCNSNQPSCIFRFTRKSMEELDKCDVYKRISTRVWKIPNNFLAFEYKAKHPEVFWEAEFSDPLLFDIYNKRRDVDTFKNITDDEYLARVNDEIAKLNEKEKTDFKLLENPTNAYLLVEYLAYLFADRVVFTNRHQREVMLSQFPIDIKDFVMAKSEIKPHPILPEEYYHIKEYDADFDSSKINIGYFGNIYSKRNFESVFCAFETLNHKYKDRLAFHFYINDKRIFNELTKDLEIYQNFCLNDIISYLDFLNLTTKFDILIINDLITSDCFEVNPYRPSKLSDYLGSGSDIWALCEKGSTLDDQDVRYKSYVDDYGSVTEMLVRILEDNGYADDDYTVSDPIQYFKRRLTALNIAFDEEHKTRTRRDVKNAELHKKHDKLKEEAKKLRNENEELKGKNDEIMSSNSWKVTKSLRKVGKIVKK